MVLDVSRRLAEAAASQSPEDSLEDAQRALDVYVVKDATAEWVQARHDRAIEQMGYAFARIVSVADIEEVWRAGA